MMKFLLGTMPNSNATRFVSMEHLELPLLSWWEQWKPELLSGVFVFELAGIAVVVLLSLLFSKLLGRELAKRIRGDSEQKPETFGSLARGKLADSTPRLLLAIGFVFGGWVLASGFETVGLQARFLHSFAVLATAWATIYAATLFVRDRFWIRLLASAAYLIAALSIFGLLLPVGQLLDSFSVNFGETRVSLLGFVKAGFLAAFLFWLASLFSKVMDRKVVGVRDLSPSMQVLIAKSVRVGLFAMAFLLAIGLVGIDLTGLAIFGGAIGVGIGFGLQTVVSNLISGFILLIDRSIKPGDVIEIENTYGVIHSLGARYVSVLTRDGTEHLVPNEDLIKRKVTNWSFSDNNIRVRAPVGIAYSCDPREAIRLCIEAAQQEPRVLNSPPPNCLLRGFGDSSVDLELRFWIADPQDGVGNITSAVLLRVWDIFQQNGIEIPFPQRDLHLRSALPIQISQADSSSGES